ncbi:ABC transporter ATP-binding protein [Hyalangium rubrum]|uniref:ABC transporter ATP-binding protein n=1 Tax=Hyalangium rubrum TaxID=3103134 RepID=A0ABU5HIG0_9BACT|nr:ABC transporter ATP-binding protein [Hyalangium sp. s54d21]MDY7233141.1 ABC transporter ATP-binding protein [Hyalangium sp. s54d21]
MSEFAPPAIEAKGLVKHYGGTVAVDGIDLVVQSGECVGLLGPNGAGKSTTMELLEGLQAPTSGSVSLLGQRWEGDSTGLRARIGIAPQETRFYGRLTVHETLELFRSFYPRGLSVDELIGLARLEEKRGAYVMHLSGGQLQRLSLAAALAGDPELLFLDEPTAGLDPQSREALWDILSGLKAGGRTVVLTTHYLGEAQMLCDWVAIVDRGRIVTQGKPTELIAGIGGGHVIELVASRAFAPETLADLPTLHNLFPRGAGFTLHVAELHLALPWLMERVRSLGMTLRALSTREATLDDVFLAFTGRSLRESEPT